VPPVQPPPAATWTPSAAATPSEPSYAPSAAPAPVATAAPERSNTAWIPRAIIIGDLAIIIVTIGLVLLNG
jgi:hypothetical protein